VVVKRNPNGSFGKATWVNLNYPKVMGLTSNDSVAGNQVVGIVIGGGISYQATVNP
jgi:trimeric autotransporter adhesin